VSLGNWEHCCNRPSRKYKEEIGRVNKEQVIECSMKMFKTTTKKQATCSVADKFLQ